MKQLGIVGGGQLGRMMAVPAAQLGFDVTVLDPTPNSPAGQVATQVVGDFKDAEAVRSFGAGKDFLTFEIELAHAEVLSELQKQGVAVNPDPATLAIIKDKLKQKEYLQKLGVPVADFRKVESRPDLETAAADFGYPFVLKSRAGSYDGRGNARINTEKDMDEALEKLGSTGLYAERFVAFKKELAIMVARGSDGTLATYPLVESVHERDILQHILVPASVEQAVEEKAAAFAQTVISHFDGAGVFGIEMFLAESGEVMINEIAPRVHNTGHFTIEANRTSQFEQHIRAVTQLPLGDTSMQVPAAAMVNILGEREGPAEVKGLERALDIPGVSVHIYGKAQTKVDRKMGHITAVADTADTALVAAQTARKSITI